MDLDGQSILFVTDRDGNSEIYIVGAEGGDAANLTNDLSDDFIGVYSPIYDCCCFIATAAYGSFLHEDVQVLRNFRDMHLLTNAPGRAFVEFYYSTSPPIAGVISEYGSLRLLTRIALTPVVYFVKYPAGGFVILVMLIGGSVAWRRRRRERNRAEEEGARLISV